MVVNSRVLFTAILQHAGADCVCDIGSRDGEDALRFRALFPKARILAFEANKFNYQKMAENPKIASARVELLPCAVSNADGEAVFHITMPSEHDQCELSGTSSLLVTDRVALREKVIVPTRRLDTILPELCPEAAQIGLWIDVEGAEYQVAEGLSGISDKVIAMHVETATKEMRPGQRLTNELTDLLDTLGFVVAGSSFDSKSDWGDVVFVQKKFQAQMGKNLDRYIRKARTAVVFNLGSIGNFLKTRAPWLYQIAYRFWHRAGVKSLDRGKGKDGSAK